ncbi:hypothetical protein LguiA_002634 [Lonicera macranthoides]
MSALSHDPIAGRSVIPLRVTTHVHARVCVSINKMCKNKNEESPPLMLFRSLVLRAVRILHICAALIVNFIMEGQVEGPHPKKFQSQGPDSKGPLRNASFDWREDAWFAALGRYCIHMTWNDRGAISLEGFGLKVVENVEEAEFVLAHGTEALGLSFGASRPTKVEDL